MRRPTHSLLPLALLLAAIGLPALGLPAHAQQQPAEPDAVEATPAHSVEVAAIQPPLAQAPVTSDRLVDVPVLKPAGGEVKGLAFLFVDEAAEPAARAEDLQAALLARGLAVMPVALQPYLDRLSEEEGCHYIVGELTDAAQSAEREMGIVDYKRPLLVGTGAGATLVRATLGQTPDSTVAGAVALGYRNYLKTHQPMCPYETEADLDDGAYAYHGGDPFFAPIRLIDGDAAAVAELTDAQPLATADTGGSDAVTAMADAAAELAEADAGTVHKLPLIEVAMPAKTKPKGLAIVYSGDGGWRDLDKDVGERLAQRGIATVGVDSLRYFWSERSPQEIAADLDKIVETYTGRYDTNRVMLVGYSMGANTLPFAWPYLKPETQKRLALVALLAPEATTGFSVSVSGWMGGATGDADVIGAIAKMPPRRVMCINGKDEDEPPCADPRLAATRVVMLPGGHHFDEDYTALADMLIGKFLPPESVVQK